MLSALNSTSTRLLRVAPPLNRVIDRNSGPTLPLNSVTMEAGGIFVPLARNRAFSVSLREERSCTMERELNTTRRVYMCSDDEDNTL